MVIGFVGLVLINFFCCAVQANCDFRSIIYRFDDVYTVGHLSSKLLSNVRKVCMPESTRGERNSSYGAAKYVVQQILEKPGFGAFYLA